MGNQQGCCKDESQGAGVNALEKNWASEAASENPPKMAEPAAVSNGAPPASPQAAPAAAVVKAELEKAEVQRAEAEAAAAAAKQQLAKAEAEAIAAAAKRDQQKAEEEARAKAEAEEAAKKARENVCDVVFEVPGSAATHAVRFTKRPVGFDFHREAPIKVDRVVQGSHAEQLGVQPGWVVRSIQGEDMHGRDFEAKFDHFCKALRDLPGGMQVNFRLPDGSEKAVMLTQKPVGFDFRKATPITVDLVEPGGHAAEVGIQPGWVIHRINGEDMSGKHFDTKYQHLLNGLSALPGPPSSGRLTGVQVAFEVPGAAEKTLWFSRKPVGFDFHCHAPITVDKVIPGSHADELGVQKGWVVRGIHGWDMGRKSFEEKFEHLTSALQSLPGGAEIVFQVPQEDRSTARTDLPVVGPSERKVVLTQKPVGFDFNVDHAPIMVDSVLPGSYAAELGIQKGWVIRRINGEDMGGKDYVAHVHYLTSCLRSLPTKSSKTM